MIIKPSGNGRLYIYAKIIIMNFDFFDVFGIFSDIADMLNNILMIGSGSDKPVQDKKSRHLTEKTGVVFLIIAFVILFFVFKKPLPFELHIGSLAVVSIIGTLLSLIFFLILYRFGKYDFTSVFRWLFFSGSSLLFFHALAFYIYFRSGISG